ncbi:MAG: family 20 glycosylhydrolase, partial [Tannerellaceae bacterium]
MKNVSFRQLLLCASISLLGVGVELNAQKQLLPKPQTIHIEEGLLVYNQFKLSCDPEVSKLVQDQLSQLNIQIANESKLQLSVKLIDTISGVKNNMDEAYSLSITPAGIELLATTTQGVYWGLQTLAQLVQENKPGKLPYISITDWPSFRVRGFMQDVGRSYISMDELKREIAALSKYKINVFHWHLTENQAWRLESKKYPQLTSAENMTRMPGKFYTQAEARELVEFCKAHNVTLIPELDMPGHSAAFERAFKCDMQSEEGMAILKDLIAEACVVLDVPYLHIGTDEVEFTNPRFVPEMVDFVRAQGKKVISWNPGWNYKEGEVDMTQMWSYRGKATPGVPAMDSRLHYLNHYDTFADIYALYTSRIGNVSEGSDQHAGTILA